jgi:uncharacterized protein YpmB
MDINTKNSSGMMNGMPPVNKSQGKIGPIIGVLVIVLIIIVASLYFFGQRLNTQSNSNIPKDVILNETVLMSTSTDINSIEEDLNVQLNDVDYSF